MENEINVKVIHHGVIRGTKMVHYDSPLYKCSQKVALRVVTRDRRLVNCVYCQNKMKHQTDKPMPSKAFLIQNADNLIFERKNSKQVLMKLKDLV